MNLTRKLALAWAAGVATLAILWAMTLDTGRAGPNATSGFEGKTRQEIEEMVDAYRKELGVKRKEYPVSVVHKTRETLEGIQRKAEAEHRLHRDDAGVVWGMHNNE